MTYRLIATDLDDTLLNENSKISERNRKAIEAARRKGVYFTLATGRMAQSTFRYARQLEVELPLITYHGALVCSLHEEKPYYYRPLEFALVRDIIKEAQERSHHVNLYLEDRLFVKEYNRITSFYKNFSSVEIEPVGDLVEYLDCRGMAPPKVTIIDKEEAMEEIEVILKERFPGRLNLMLSRPSFLEITHNLATKGQALKTLAKDLGINREEIIAFGDSINDLDMLEYAGLGVAVENARPQAKEVADIIAPSHQEDGVAEIIEQYVL